MQIGYACGQETAPDCTCELSVWTNTVNVPSHTSTVIGPDTQSPPKHLPPLLLVVTVQLAWKRYFEKHLGSFWTCRFWTVWGANKEGFSSRGGPPTASRHSALLTTCANFVSLSQESGGRAGTMYEVSRAQRSSFVVFGRAL